MHFNYRYFETDGGVWWFGGGMDITPSYLDTVRAFLPIPLMQSMKKSHVFVLWSCPHPFYSRPTCHLLLMRWDCIALSRLMG